MGFISLLFLMLLWPVWLLIVAAAIVLPILGVALNVVAGFLLVVNLLFLAVLMFARAKWKQTGRMERSYIDSFEGWKRYGLLSIRVLLTGVVVWEALVVVLCGAYLVIQPFQYLPIP